jgi:S-layer protein
VSSDYASKAALTVTGAGKVNLGSTVGFDGSTIDASANSGGLTIGLSSNVQTYKGSSGNDIVSGTTPVSSTASIDGGAGIDTLAITLLDPFVNGAVFKNFEVLDLTGAASVNGGTLDISQLTNSSITGVVLNSAKATLNLSGLVETADGFNVTLVNGQSSSATTLNFDSTSISGNNDVLNLIYTPATTFAPVGALNIEGIETLKITSGGQAGTFNSAKVADNALKLVEITGSQNYDLTVQAQGGSGVSQLTKVDASQATGQVTFNVAAATATGGQSAMTLLGGSGDDTFILTNSTVANSSGATITTNGGADTVNVTSAALQNISSASTLQYTTITDFSVTDKINFGSTGFTFDGTAASIGGATDLLSALNAAVSSTLNRVTWFQFNNDTYVVLNKTTTGLSTDDIVVKLTGTTDLSTMHTNGTELIF